MKYEFKKYFIRFLAYFVAGLCISFLFSSCEAKAAVYNANDFEIMVNDTLVMGDDGGGLWDGGYALIHSGNEVNMEINVNNIGNKAGDNLLVTVTFCSTATYYGSILTPGYDLTGATLINNYSIQRSNTPCTVGGYPGVIMQSIWNLSVPGNSFGLHSWGGTTDNYNVLVDVTGMTISDFDPSMAQEFLQFQQNQQIIDQNNQLINGFNNLQNEQQETNDKLDDLNENITNDDTSEASGEAEGFFSNFENDDHGLSSIITAPLEFIESLSSATCQPISVNIPLVDFQGTLPCMSQYYDEHFSTLFTVYQTILVGLVCYRICLDIYRIVKGFKDPESDKIEVVDL